MNTFSENFSISSGWRKKPSNLLKIFAVSAGILCLVFIFHIFSPAIKNIFFKISQPAGKTFWSAGAVFSGYLNSFLSLGNLSGENEKLKNENQNLLSQIIALQAQNSANQAQAGAVLSCADRNFNLVMAGVIGLDGQDTLSINKGSDDGLLKGMPVISQQNVLYGKVEKVYKNFSHVSLISSDKSLVNVKIDAAEEGAAEIDGIVKGKGGLGVYLDLVQVDSKISQGDVLITSSLEKTFPKDLLVGRILKVEKNDQKPFQQAEIEPFFSLKGLDNLFVITNYKR